MMRIDHFMFAVTDLDRGVEWATDLFGTAPAYGGEHVGLGTRNALLSLGDTYLELIAPDPTQNLDNNFGGRLAALAKHGLVTWAAQGDLALVKAALMESGVVSTGPVRTQRKTKEGELLQWDLLFPSGHSFGTRLPFFIDWLDCDHPSCSNPVGADQAKLELQDPESEALAELFKTLGIDVPVAVGEPSLAVRIATARGEIILESTPETVALSMR